MNSLNRRGFLAGLAGGVLAQAAPTPEPLNFVFILADDLGWRDLGCYGSRFYETPNIDRLAAEGMRFTNAYAAAPLCSPTRASIMTGKYPARLGFTHVTQLPSLYKPDPADRWLQPSTASELPLAEITIAEALKTAGYVSGCVGKWHLGSEPFYPEKQGFDVNIGGGHIAMPTSHFYPNWRENPRGLRSLWASVPLDGRPGEYLTDRLGNEAVKFIDQHKHQPFFLYLSHYAVHIPIEAKAEMVPKYRAKVRVDDSQNNPDYAAMIESMDESVGAVMRQLQQSGVADRTVVVFYSDNGGVNTGSARRAPATSNAPLRYGKTSLYEGGIRVPLIVRWPGAVKPDSVCDTPVISSDFYPTMVEMADIRKDPGNPIDGLSLVPLLKQTGSLKRDTLYWHYPHSSDNNCRYHSAVRCGDYKLIEYLEDARVELYNLAADTGETKNLAGKEPQKAAELLGMLRRWRVSVGAKELTPNPSHVPIQPL
jgi:arylsulfatase A-like enzyme